MLGGLVPQKDVQKVTLNGCSFGGARSAAAVGRQQSVTLEESDSTDSKDSK